MTLVESATAVGFGGKMEGLVSGVVGEANPEPCSVLAVLCSHGGLEMNHLVVGRAATAGCWWE